jgi:hypothetical protein
MELSKILKVWFLRDGLCDLPGFSDKFVLIGLVSTVKNLRVP